MALKQADRVRETSTTTGTGAMALAGAPSGYRTFSSVLSDGDTCTYAIALDADFEVGVGTYNASGNTLTRTTVTASSNAGAAVNWGAGSKSIFISPLASDPAFSEELRVPAGSVSSAAVQANDDPNSGVYFPAADTVAVTVGGTQALKVETTAITAASPLVVPAGSTSSAAVQASGDPNTGITFPAADTIALVEGGVEALRVNSSGEVIVGNGDAVASPAARTLRGTDASGSDAAAGNLTIRPGLATGNAASGALIVQTGPAGASGSTLQTATERLRVTASGDIVAGNGDAAASPAAGTIRGTNGSGTNIAGAALILQGGRGTGSGAGGYVAISTSAAGTTGSALRAAAEALRVDSSQRLLVGVTSATSAGGVLQLKSGVTFPATASLSSNANTLDDYEEGSWSPSMSGGGSSVAASSGQYVKIGSFVFCAFDIYTNTASPTASAVAIGGLPFTIQYGQQSFAVYFSNLATTTTNVVGVVNTANNNILLYRVGSAATSMTQLLATNLFNGTGSTLYGHFFYGTSQ